MEQNQYFPVFIDIHGKEILVFGAGNIAGRRIKTLLSFGADIKVTAREASKEVLQLAEEKKISLQIKEFEPEDIKKCLMVIAATDDEDTNNSIYSICKEKGITVNCSHDKTKCDFYFPSVIREGDYVIGITSGGRDHAGVKKIADRLRKFFKE